MTIFQALFAAFLRFAGFRFIVPLANKQVAEERFTVFFNEAAQLTEAEIKASKKSGLWVQIAPYGSHPHTRGLQVFEKADAEIMVNNFKAGTGLSVGERTFGLSWYIGHPDHPEWSDIDRDSKAYGRIKELRAGKNGLEARVKFGNKGREYLLDEAFHGHSPNWGADKINGAYRPRVLFSVGWTNEPNIDVSPALPNQTNNKETMDTKAILLALANAGITVPHTAGEGDIPGLIAGLATAKGKVEEERDALANDKAELETKLKGFEAIANERKQEAEKAVDAAIANQKVAPAQREEKITGICEADDYKAALAEVVALGNNKTEAKPPKTSSELSNQALGSAEPEDGDGMTAAQRTERITALVNAKKATGLSHDAAYSAVRSDPANRSLFGKTGR